MNATLDAFWLSLKVATVATCCLLPIGILTAIWLSRARGIVRTVAETIVAIPLVLPPTVVGFFLLRVLGNGSAFGRFLRDGLHISWLFTWQAAAIASGIMAFPLLARTLSASLSQIDREYFEIGRTLGASEAALWWKVALPLAFPGLVAGVGLAFARALGEFGATLMVAGNIPGTTQTLPLLLYERTLSGDDASAIWAAVLLCAATVPAGILLVFLTKSRGRGG